MIIIFKSELETVYKYSQKGRKWMEKESNKYQQEIDFRRCELFPKLIQSLMPEKLAFRQSFIATVHTKVSPCAKTIASAAEIPHRLHAYFVLFHWKGKSYSPSSESKPQGITKSRISEFCSARFFSFHEAKSTLLGTSLTALFPR